MSEEFVQTTALMGTVVTIHVVGAAAEERKRPELAERVQRAMGWFRSIEETCTRFDERSELRRLSARIGTPVPVSAMLYHTIDFALKVAEETGGAFDPTVGHSMEFHGFNREYRSGRPVPSPLTSHEGASYRDVRLDPIKKTITLLRPLVLDVGAVAKGFAVDLAARELEACENFSVNAGGDLFLRGSNGSGKPWSIGIQHPRESQQLIRKLRLTDTAVCTSGDYERRSTDNGHHLLDPRTGKFAAGVASVTVVASSAMVADVLATAAFVLGPHDGLQLLEDYGVGGLIVTQAMEQITTRIMPLN